MAGGTGITGRQVRDESLTGDDILDGSVQRKDLDVTTVGQAVTTKIIAGSGVVLTSTGVDSGTGDVTINAAGGGSFINVDGGQSDSLYLPDMCLDGGDSSGS